MGRGGYRAQDVSDHGGETGEETGCLNRHQPRAALWISIRRAPSEGRCFF